MNFIVFNCLVILLIWSLVKMLFSNPGQIPKEFDDAQQFKLNQELSIAENRLIDDLRQNR